MKRMKRVGLGKDMMSQVSNMFLVAVVVVVDLSEGGADYVGGW